MQKCNMKSMSINKDDKQFKCSLWQKSYKSSDQVHRGIKKYMCESRGKCFGQEGVLKRHMQEIHEKIR